MQTSNNYDLGVFNGDIGTVERIYPEQRALSVLFDERSVRYEWNSMDELEPAYACSIHKSQGSEWPYVIVVLDPGADRVASREWIYTAISRASRACFLVGTEETLRRQLRRAELPGRKTLLVELIGRELQCQQF